MLVEVVAFNLHSALVAATAGADRIEICDNIHEGGTTPSYGCVRVLKQKLSIPVFPMIRPRGGDFLYTNEETDAMLADIELFKNIGCEGIVVGCLLQNGTVDKEKLTSFVKAAHPMSVTFHRAFDRCENAFKALEDIIECGCSRILTSGQMPFAHEGIPLIRELILKAANRILIIPGGGITSDIIMDLVEETKATEYHTPVKAVVSSRMNYCQEKMQETLETISVNVNELHLIKQLIQRKA
ncbi:copper homeostasis protein CutC [Pedobacter metabolipauper]|uniref:PF03932 family protein CutC n=1 Tax=Pedobacter metabolipauper TaxID=425513 RepID=A0A4R6SWY9_9SPHI|nr:copper homeostasis protein CutC [Pedobacter metabolipauper]TDQ09939.1 copper homeostasis protein [Pedobacter metabolipauper]